MGKRGWKNRWHCWTRPSISCKCKCYTREMIFPFLGKAEGGFTLRGSLSEIKQGGWKMILIRDVVVWHMSTDTDYWHSWWTQRFYSKEMSNDWYVVLTSQPRYDEQPCCNNISMVIWKQYWLFKNSSRNPRTADKTLKLSCKYNNEL